MNVINFLPRYFSTQVIHPIIRDQINGFVGVPQYALDASIAFFTGLSNLVLAYPLEVMYIKQVTDGDKRYRGFSETYRKLTKDGGITNLYTAFWTSLFGLMAYKGLNFVSMEYFKKIVFENYDQASNISKGLYKGVSHLIVGTLLYPLDTIRHRLIDDVGQKVPIWGGGPLECARRINRSEGVFGFFKGFECIVGPSLLAAGVGAAMVLAQKNK